MMDADLRQLLQRRQLCGEVRDFISNFANEVRLKLLCELMLQGEMTVGALAEATGAKQPTVSQQLKQMRLCGLVSRNPDGNRCLYRITNPLAEETMQFLGSIASRLGAQEDH